jgi:spermidine synthase
VHQQPFFQNMHRALRPGGVVCTQGECLWLHLDLIKQVADMYREVRLAPAAPRRAAPSCAPAG